MPGSILTAALLLLLPVPVVPQAPVVRASAVPTHVVPLPAVPADKAATPPAAVPVRADGLVGTWYPPVSGKRGPVILALGGSEGGERGGKAIAAALALQGYGVLALAYFGAEGLPPVLEDIPLDYFDRAIAWMAHQPLADPRRMGIYGISIGGETALVVAARHPELKAVVAAVPSSVVWQGYDPKDYSRVTSTYSLDGKPVPYLPYDISKGFSGIHDLYTRSLAARDAHPDAAIPVERIGGAILLLSARGDTLWPSTDMADQVMARLDARHVKGVHRHVSYADAGHGAMVPPRDPSEGPAQAEDAFHNLGGTEAGNSAARAAMWREATTFLAAHLGRPTR